MLMMVLYKKVCIIIIMFCSGIHHKSFSKRAPPLAPCTYNPGGPEPIGHSFPDFEGKLTDYLLQ